MLREAYNQADLDMDLWRAESVDKTRRALARGADPNMKGGGIPIVEAAALDDDEQRAREMVDLLLAAGAHNWWKESVQAWAQGATRMRVRSGGICHRHPEREKTLLDENDPAAIRSLVHGLEVDIVKSKNVCMCCGNPSMEFYRNGRLINAVSIHHGLRLRFGTHRGPRCGAVQLTPAGADHLCHWLAQRGVDGPLKELTEARARRSDAAKTGDELEQ